MTHYEALRKVRDKWYERIVGRSGLTQVEGNKLLNDLAHLLDTAPEPDLDNLKQIVQEAAQELHIAGEKTIAAINRAAEAAVPNGSTWHRRAVDIYKAVEEVRDDIVRYDTKGKSIPQYLREGGNFYDRLTAILDAAPPSIFRHLNPPETDTPEILKYRWQCDNRGRTFQGPTFY